MATTLAGTVHIGLDFDYIKSITGLTAVSNLRYNNSPTAYTNGTGSNQVNAMYTSFAYSLAATTVSLDLNLQEDIHGDTVNFVKVKLIYVKNLSTTAGQYLKIDGNFWDGDTSNLGPMGGTSPAIYLGPGATYHWDSPIDGATVTNTTKDTITFTNAATFTFDLVILGTLS